MTAEDRKADITVFLPTGRKVWRNTTDWSIEDGVLTFIDASGHAHLFSRTSRWHVEPLKAVAR